MSFVIFNDQGLFMAFAVSCIWCEAPLREDTFDGFVIASFDVKCPSTHKTVLCGKRSKVRVLLCGVDRRKLPIGSQQLTRMLYEFCWC